MNIVGSIMLKGFPHYVTRNIHEFGPGLVSCFVTDDHFRTSLSLERIGSTFVLHRMIHQFDVKMNISSDIKVSYDMIMSGEDIYSWAELKIDDNLYHGAVEKLKLMIETVNVDQQMAIVKKLIQMIQRCHYQQLRASRMKELQQIFHHHLRHHHTQNLQITWKDQACMLWL
jgi:hypothetical protein